VGDLGRLRQTLLNLIGNAVKFTGQGEVSVRVRCLRRFEREIDLQFSVADTGIGIAPEKQSLIFQAFAQADTSTTRNYGGSGLGLTICSRLVEMMGGRLWVDSTLGKGSTFYFTARFNIAAASRPSVAAPTASQNELLQLPLIVVDDNATNRAILTEMASGWGMKVTAVDSGSVASNAYGKHMRLARCFAWRSSMHTCRTWMGSTWPHGCVRTLR
jgi:two-component system sensor histidine kinase/response regulator